MLSNKANTPSLFRRKINSLSILFTLLLDRIRGYDFVAIIEPEAAGLNPFEAYRSSPSGGSHLISLLNVIKISPRDNILDIGCGKGSALRSMLSLPFNQIAGIELSKIVGDICKRNFSLINDKRVSVYACDALLFDAYSQFNIYYFYDPFPAKVFAQVLLKIRTSNIKNDHEQLIIYNNPTCHSLILQQGFKLHRTYPDKWGNGINVYSNMEIGFSRLDASLEIKL